MKAHLTGRLLLAVALMTALPAPPAKAQEGQTNASASVAQPQAAAKASEPVKVDSTAGKQNQAPGQSPTSASTASTDIADILKMADVKVSPDVIKTFIEHSTVVSAPTAADIIALKEHGVPDDITTILVSRGAETRARMVQAAVRASNFSGYGHLDPESYEYFQYYYLYPRTLASVYQNLSPYSAPPAYGYYRPGYFNPAFPGRYPPVRRAGFGMGLSP